MTSGHVKCSRVPEELRLLSLNRCVQLLSAVVGGTTIKVYSSYTNHRGTALLMWHSFCSGTERGNDELKPATWAIILP